MGKNLKNEPLGKFLSQIKNETYMAKFHNRKGELKYIFDKDLKSIREKLESALTEDLRGTSCDSSKMTVNDFFSLWISKYKFELAGNTKAGYRNAYQHISNAIGEMLLSDVKAINFIDIFLDLQENDYKSSSIVQVKMISQQMFESALSNGFINKNPLYGMILTSQKDQKDMMLSDEDMEHFFSYVHKEKHIWESLYLLLFLTGMRSGEIRSLIWDNINFEKKQIVINRNVREINKKGERKYEINNPKTKCSKRVIPMTPEIQNVLKNQQQNHKSVDIDTYLEFGDLVFTNCGKMISQSVLCYSLTRIEQRMNHTGIVIKHLHPHMFRHLFTSNAIAAGMSIKAVSSILGHKSIRTTLNCYDHPTSVTLKVAMNNFKAVGVKMV